MTNRSVFKMFVRQYKTSNKEMKVSIKLLDNTIKIFNLSKLSRR